MVSLPPQPLPRPTQDLPCYFPGAQAGVRGWGRANTVQQPLTPPSPQLTPLRMPLPLHVDFYCHTVLPITR